MEPCFRCSLRRANRLIIQFYKFRTATIVTVSLKLLNVNQIVQGKA